MAMIGEGTTRGKAALLRIDATTNQNFAAVSPGKALVPEFLFYQLESCYEPLRHWSHGTNQHALNTKWCLISRFGFRMLKSRKKSSPKLPRWKLNA